MNYRQEEIRPYGGAGDKAQQVERMFDNIAASYDTINHSLSWNIDKLWRRAAVRHIAALHPHTVLDVATGTGDFAIGMARALRPDSITGIDLSEGMMSVGRSKVYAAGLSDIISFRRDDCMALSFADGSFDAVTSSFGVRNFADLDRGLREMRRVLRPGGTLCILELTTPRQPIARVLFRLYAHTLLPAIGKVISGDGQAYTYLTRSIEAFPQGEEMADIMRRAGFSATGFRRLTMGICTLFYATK